MASVLAKLDGTNVRASQCSADKRLPPRLVRSLAPPSNRQRFSLIAADTVNEYFGNFMTLTEKILARASGKARVQAGDNVWVKADVLMTHDVCGTGTIGVFKREFGQDAKVWDRNKVVIIPDHYIFTADSKSNRNVDILRDFVKEQEITYFYDVIDEPNGHWKFDAGQGQLKRQCGAHYAGVCHTALPQKGHPRPGEVLFGTDSHTCMAGAFNEFATGIGNTDAGFVMGTGKLLLKVPPTMRFVFHGELPPYLMAKDLILAVIGEIGCDGATYRAMGL